MKSGFAASRRLAVEDTFGNGSVNALLSETQRLFGCIGVTGLGSS